MTNYEHALNLMCNKHLKSERLNAMKMAKKLAKAGKTMDIIAVMKLAKKDPTASPLQWLNYYFDLHTELFGRLGEKNQPKTRITLELKSADYEALSSIFDLESLPQPRAEFLKKIYDDCDECKTRRTALIAEEIL